MKIGDRVRVRNLRAGGPMQASYPGSESIQVGDVGTITDITKSNCPYIVEIDGKHSASLASSELALVK